MINPNSSQNKDENNSEINENTGILNANVVKPRIESTINGILKKFFESYYFENQSKENKDNSHNQDNIDKICNEVIKEAYSQINGFKLVCTGHLVGAGNAPFFFNSNLLWDKKTDYYITSLYKGQNFYVYICLFIIAP